MDSMEWICVGTCLNRMARTTCQEKVIVGSYMSMFVICLWRLADGCHHDCLRANMSLLVYMHFIHSVYNVNGTGFSAINKCE